MCKQAQAGTNKTKGTSARQVQLLTIHPMPFSCPCALCSVLWYMGQAISFLKQANTPTMASDLFSGAENAKNTSFLRALGQHHLSLTGTSLHQSFHLWHTPSASVPPTVSKYNQSCGLPGILHVLSSQEGRKRNTGALDMWDGMDGQPGPRPLGPSTTH